AVPRRPVPRRDAAPRTARRRRPRLPVDLRPPNPREGPAMNKTVATVVIPIGLGVAAAVFNLMAVRSATATVDLTIVKEHVQPGPPLTEEMLGKLTVRADPEVFKPVVRYEDRGVLIGRPASRPLAAKEVVLLADIRLSGTFDVRANLRSGEHTLTLA